MEKTQTASRAAEVATGAAVHLTGLRKHYGDVHAVDGVDLTIAPGEIVALLGPNGAGKSTTVDMILGLTKPDHGEVTVFGSSPTASRSPRSASKAPSCPLLLTTPKRDRPMSFTYVRLEILRTFRNTRFVTFAIAFPVLLFLLQATVLMVNMMLSRRQDDLRHADGAAAAHSGPADRRAVRRRAPGCSTVADVARVLRLSEGTVRNHLSSAIGKTGARQGRSHPARGRTGLAMSAACGRPEGWLTTTAAWPCAVRVKASEKMGP
jgi:energy-coupling factor transporter ATP-binding protein EcfA2